MMDQDTSGRVRPGKLTWVMLHRVLRRVRVVKVTANFVYFRYYKRAVGGYTHGKIRREVLTRQTSLPKLNSW